MAVVQYTFTHKQYIEQHKLHTQYKEQHYSLIRKSADRAPSLEGIPWHLLYKWGKSKEKPQSGYSENANWHGDTEIWRHQIWRILRRTKPISELFSLPTFLYFLWWLETMLSLICARLRGPLSILRKAKVYAGCLWNDTWQGNESTWRTAPISSSFFTKPTWTITISNPSGSLESHRQNWVSPKTLAAYWQNARCGNRPQS